MLENLAIVHGRQAKSVGNKIPKSPIKITFDKKMVNVLILTTIRRTSLLFTSYYNAPMH